MSTTVACAALLALTLAIATGQAHALPGGARATAEPPVTIAPPPGAVAPPAPNGGNQSSTKPLGPALAADLQLSTPKSRYGNTSVVFLEYAPGGGASTSWLCSQRDFFDDIAAGITCRRYGFTGGGYRLGAAATVAHANAAGKQLLYGIITLFQCPATASALENCTYAEVLSNPRKGCTKNELIVLKCYGDGALRLADSPKGNPYEGRVQMFWEGQWQNVCTQGFDPKTAKAACALMGLSFNTSQPAINVPTATYDPTNQRFQQPNLWIPRIQCLGNETVLYQCGSQRDPVTASIGNATKCYVSDKGRGLDAGLRCNYQAPPPAVSGARAMAALHVALVLLAACAAALQLVW